jgi:hypothetical protein
MTLAEIMAAKEAKKAAAKPEKFQLKQEEEVILTPDGPHYAKLVGADGKFIKWLPKPESTGLKITPEIERAALAASIKQSMDACAPKAQPPAPRELGAITPGERIPMSHPDQGAPDAEWEWFDSMHSFESDLGIVIDPNGEQAWIAVKAFKTKPPILLHRLPLFNRKRIELDPF